MPKPVFFNPDGWAITFPCIDGGTVSSVEVRQFDGLNWEAFYEGQGAAIKAFSKEAGGDTDTVAEAARKPAKAKRAPRSAALLWLLSVLEALLTFALPVVLILLATRNGGQSKKPPWRAEKPGVPWYLPGKPMTGGVGG